MTPDRFRRALDERISTWAHRVVVPVVGAGERIAGLAAYELWRRAQPAGTFQ